MTAAVQSWFGGCVWRIKLCLDDKFKDIILLIHVDGKVAFTGVSEASKFNF